MTDIAPTAPPRIAPTATIDVARRLAALQRRHRACTRCADAGWIDQARPVFSGRWGQRIVLVGQAPGPIEHDEGRPFAGRAGRQLMRWLTRAGFSGEDDARDRIYFISATTCFPGRRPDGAGDRRPTPREVEACTPWRDAVLRLLDPPLVIPVGSLGLSLFLPGRLDEYVGRAVTPDGLDVPELPPPPSTRRVLVALPHPSGQSRWLNDARQAALLDAALDKLRALIDWAEHRPVPMV